MYTSELYAVDDCAKMIHGRKGEENKLNLERLIRTLRKFID